MIEQRKLLEKIRNKKAKIGVIGLGYVGLPLAILLAKHSFKVTGFVRSEKKRDSLNKGMSHLSDKKLDADLKKVIGDGNFSVGLTSENNLEDNDIFIICVPTPVDAHKRPDLSDLRQVAKRLTEIDLENKLIINESTVAPFTTRDILGQIGKNYFLVCSPERIDPGSNFKTTENIAKVIGGADAESLELGVALYRQILKEELVEVQSLEAAEMTKMLENTYRMVNIALINEFAKLAEKIGVDILDVIKAAKTKWSFQAHYPSIGVGGHCIPVDPYYILELAKKRKIPMQLVQNGLFEVEQMPKYILKKVANVYKKGMKVVLYGITYKKDVKDLRESPALVLCRLLQEKAIDFSVYDPLFTNEEIASLQLKPAKREIVNIFVAAIDHVSLHKDYPFFVGENTSIIDGQNFFTKKIGKEVFGVGRTLL